MCDIHFELRERITVVQQFPNTDILEKENRLFEEDYKKRQRFERGDEEGNVEINVIVAIFYQNPPEMFLSLPCVE